MFRQLCSFALSSSKIGTAQSFCLRSQERLKTLTPSHEFPSKNYHTTAPVCGAFRDMSKVGMKVLKKSLVATGEQDIVMSNKDQHLFPDENTPSRVFNGIMFKDLPIVNVKATSNNTHINLTDANGLVQMYRTCGVDGFKNARKGTNVAAQATGFALGKKMAQKGIKTVRARIQGLGAGRMSSLKGLSLSGIEIVSVTDTTPVSWNPPRPRKQRRI